MPEATLYGNNAAHLGDRLLHPIAEGASGTMAVASCGVAPVPAGLVQSEEVGRVRERDKINSKL